ncbi:MAG: adenosylcobinamide-GDP ribazoletransferase [Candidatus Omnitrophota bacterium]
MRYFLIALQFLTRIPVRIKDKIEPRDYGYSMAWFPAVGLILGLLLALVFKLAICWFNPAIAVLLTITAYMFLTGALHVDGLSDTCDGLYGGKGDKVKILEIMKDSRIGTIGALALVLDMAFRFALLYSLPVSRIPASLILMAVLGRWGQVLFSLNAPSARQEGRGGYFSGSLTPGIFGFSSMIMLGICLFLLKLVSLVLLLVFLILIIRIAKNYFRRKIGGITGDTIGAVNEITEIFVLFFMLW